MMDSETVRRRLSLAEKDVVLTVRHLGEDA